MDEPGGVSFEVYLDESGAGVCLALRGCASIVEIEDGELAAGAKLTAEGARALAGALLACADSEVAG